MRPVQLAVVPDIEQAPSFGVLVTVYPVMGEPPLEIGAAQDRETEVFPEIAATFEGAAGIVLGVIWTLFALGRDCPAALIAFTVNV